MTNFITTEAGYQIPDEAGIPQIAPGDRVPVTIVPPRRWYKHPLTWVAVSAALVGIAVTLMFTIGRPSSQAATSQAPAQPATSAPATNQPTTPSPASQITSWWASTGQADTNTVQADLGNVSRDAGNQNLAAVESDGATLSADAQTALADTPASPAGFTTPYRNAMTALTQAGNDMSAGDITGATSEMRTGTADIGQATAYVQSLNG